MAADKPLDPPTILGRALDEFRRNGVVGTARCDACSDLIRVEPTGPATYRVSCSCGRFNGTMRGE